MSNAVFPTTRGLNWTVRKNPTFSNVTKKAASGKRVSYANYLQPIWDFSLSWDYMKDDTSRANGNVYSDLRTIVGFFMARTGDFDSFLFTDPDDSTVSKQWIGDGNGSTAAFQLVRDFGTFLENIQNVNGTPTVEIVDWQNAVNFLKYSQDFSQASAWSLQNGLTVTANYAQAPDGTNTANLLLTGDSGVASQGMFQIMSELSNGVTRYTYSIYVKGWNGSTTCKVGIYDGTTGTFVAATGSVLSGTATISGTSLQTVSGLNQTDWTRVQVSATAAVTNAGQQWVFIYPDNDALTTGGRGLLAWGAQSEVGSTASEYIKTTAVASVGPTALYNSARTNLIQYSNDFSQSSVWNTQQMTFGTASMVDPTGGTNTVRVLLDTAVNAEHFVEQNFTLSNGKIATASIWARAGSVPYLYLAIVQRDATTVRGAYFDLSQGALGTVESGVTATISKRWPNGWYRLSVTSTVGAGVSNPRTRVQLANSTSTKIYLGSGVGLYAFGCMTEQNTYLLTEPTRYIATTNATATVTDYTLSSTGLVTLASNLPIGNWLRWTGSFYFRVKFTEAMTDVEQFLQKLWTLKQLSFESIKL